MSAPQAGGGVHIWPASTCLISELARALAPLPADELRHCHIVLPTQRLHTWLYALLARERPAFVPPECYTFDELIDDYVQTWALDDSDTKPLGDLEQELLIATLLKRGAYEHLHSGHEHEIKQFFAELDAWDRGDDAFTKLLEVAAENIYLSADSLDTLQGRFHELRDLYQRFHQHARDVLDCQPMTTWLARRSRLVAEALRAGVPLPCQRLYLVGMTSAQSMHAPLLAALASQPQAHIWLSDGSGIGGDATPLALLRSMLGVESQCMPVPPSSRPAPIEIHKTDTALGEVAHALALAQAAIERGTAPSAIAILVTNDAAYGKPLRLLLKGAGLPANIALGTPFATTVYGTWLTAICELATDGATLTRILALAAHPLSLSWWRRQNSDGVSERLSRARLAREICATGIERGFEQLLACDRLDVEVRAYLHALADALGDLVSADGAARPLPAWRAHLGTVLETFVLARGAVLANDVDDSGVAMSAQTVVHDFLATLGTAAAALSPVLTRNDILRLVRDHLLAGDVRSVGDPLRGLQVLSVAEARYVPFELVLVLGCTEGDFPRALPRDQLVDHYFKSRLGMPGWQLLEAIEDTTFHLLQARLPRLVLLYPATRGGTPVVRSRFIEMELARGQAREEAIRADVDLHRLLHGRCGDALAVPPAAERAERRRLPTGRVSAEARQERLYSMSASALEHLLCCPYRHLLASLGVEATELPTPDDGRREGDWLHAVLEAFFTGSVRGRPVAAPLATDLPWDEWGDYAVARLGDLTDKLVPAGLRDSPLTLHVRLKSWPAFVAHLRRIYTPETLRLAAVGHRELALAATGDNLTVDIGGRTIRLRGQIDSVDVLDGMHVITDYKRAGTPAGGDVKAGVAPQLLFYAMALDAAGVAPLRQAVVGYWSILDGEWREGLAGSDVAAAARARGLIKATRGRDDVGLETVVSQMRELWGWRLDELTAPDATFAPDPSQCGFCRYAGVCRRDDPELGPGVMAGARLNAYLQGRRSAAETVTPVDEVAP